MALMTLEEEGHVPYCMLDRTERWAAEASNNDREFLHEIISDVDVRGVPAVTPMRLQTLVNLAHVALELIDIKKAYQVRVDTVTAN